MGCGSSMNDPEVKALAEQLKSFVIEKDQLQKEVNDIKSSLSKKSTTHDEIKALEHENKKLKHEIKDLEKDIKEADQDSNSKIATLEAKIKEVEEEWEKKKAERNELSKNLAEVNAESARVTEELKALNSQKAAEEKKIAELNQTLEAKQKTTKDCENLNEKIADLKETVEKKNSLISGLDKDLAELETEGTIAGYEVELAEAKKANQKIADDTVAQTKFLQECKAANYGKMLETAKDKQSELHKQLEIKKSERAAYENQTRSKESQIVTLGETLAARIANLNPITEEDFNQQIAAAESVNTEIHKETQNLEATKNAKKEELKHLIANDDQSQENEVAKQISDKEAEVHGLEADWKKRIADLKEAVQGLSNDRRSLKEEIHKLNEEHHELEKKVKKAKKHHHH